MKRVRKKPLLSAANSNINIPEDVLLSNICIRLPAKQLAQMRSLSKTWNALLSHPSFIQSHLDRSINTNEDEILVFFYNVDFSHREPCTAHPSGSPSEDLTNLIKPLPGYNSIIGSVNGLICYLKYYSYYHIHSLRIWNPSLSATTALPPYIDIGVYDPVPSFRFGFDPKTSDYKVVKIATRFDSLNFMTEEFLPVEVYSMRKDSWEFITERFPSHIKRIQDLDKVHVDGYDGHVHWLCYVDTKHMLHTIIAFDLNLEIFSEILLPDCIRSNCGRRKALGLLSRNLCVISCNYYDGYDCEVWVMDKYKVASSWIKLHVLSGYSGDIIPIGFTLNGKFLFGHDRTLALYDPNAAASKLFKAMKPVHSSTRVAQYIDSLVWPVNVKHKL
uniref:F-box/kelch-repeat protein At3g06240-like n=1 Tax=Erigeron canadensis TaxID=72917 RepID=UPI001CB92129|nr:F-box/kelch-repeat protein At3g06240-like [Erigeron canadensis]